MGSVEVLSLHLFGKSEENHKNQDILWRVSDTAGV
jgi:hypothetical protein